MPVGVRWIVALLGLGMLWLAACSTPPLGQQRANAIRRVEQENAGLRPDTAAAAPAATRPYTAN